MGRVYRALYAPAAGLEYREDRASISRDVLIRVSFFPILLLLKEIKSENGMTLESSRRSPGWGKAGDASCNDRCHGVFACNSVSRKYRVVANLTMVLLLGISVICTIPLYCQVVERDTG